MGRVFWTRFGRGGMLEEDNYPSFWMAICFMTNKVKKYTRWLWTATYRWNDTQQPTNVQYRWLGDFLGRDATAEERVGGENSRRFGRQMRRQKIEINKSVHGLWEPLVDDFTQQPTKNTRERQRGYHIGRVTWRGREESANSSILGRSSWEDAKKWIKIDECTN